MLIKSLYAGLAGGLAVTAAFYYPLYVYLPGRYVDNWQDSSQTLAFVLAGVGGLLAIAAGAVASRLSETRSRGQGALLGAVAGGTAGLLLFGLLGAAAAGTISMQDIFAHGSRPASGDEQFFTLLIDALINIAYLTYAALWSMLVGGTVLGALGGALLPAKGSPRTEEQQRITLQIGSSMAVAAFLSTLLSLIVAIAIFSLLPEQIANAAQEGGVTPDLPIIGVFNLPVGTLWLFYLASLVWSALLIRGSSSNILLPDGSTKQEHFATLTQLQTSAYVVGACPIIGAGFILLMTGTDPGIMTIVGCLLSVALGVWHIQLGRNFTAQKKALQVETPLRAPWWYWAVTVGFPVLTLVFINVARVSLPIAPFLQFLLWLAVYIGLLAWLGRKLPAQSQTKDGLAAVKAQATFLRKNALAIGVGNAVTMILAGVYNGVVQVALNMVLGPIVVLPMLTSYGPEQTGTPTSFSAIEITQTYYTVHARGAGYSLLVGAVITSVMMLVMGVILNFITKRAAAGVEPAPHAETAD